MRIASLDLGSNTFLCLIADTAGDNIKSIVCDEVRIVRLSEGVLKTGILCEAALDRAKQALSYFQEIILKHKVDKVIAVTTAVARQASNTKIFLDMVKEFGFPIQLISGSEEAEITYLGGISGLNHDDKNVMVIDIGGGSTEIIYNKNYSKSFNFGVVRLKERFDISYPIEAKITQNISDYLDDEIGEFINSIRSVNINKIVAVAGTPTTLAAMEIGKYEPSVVDGYNFSLAALNNWYVNLSQLKPDQIVTKYHIEAGRADVIALGVLILIRILTRLKQSTLQVSIRGVRFGLILKVLKDV